MNTPVGKKVAVVGLGYVGLPLAVLAAERGWVVTGIEKNQEKVDVIKAGRSPIADKELEKNIAKYPINVSLDAALVADVDVIVIAVPTPVTETYEPDLAPLISALTDIRPYVHAGQVIVVESTINPGVMDDVVIPTLAENTDLQFDREVGFPAGIALAHCPERINPGDPKWSVRNINRVIGGYSEAGVRAAKAFYDSILDAEVKVMASVTEAEAVKIMENTFRDVNIAFVNEMARSFDKLGIDVKHVIEGAATKPFAFMPHYPGSGVGGHCISVDPYYMIKRGQSVGFEHEFLKLARTINNGMPEYTVERLQKAMKDAGLSSTAKVALLGLAYKKDVDDIRESPALEIRELLTEKKIPHEVFDPYLLNDSTVTSLDEALANSQAIILATAHTQFTEALTPEKLVAAGVGIVIDGRNVLDGNALAEAGIAYYGIGRHYLPKS